MSATNSEIIQEKERWFFFFFCTVLGSFSIWLGLLPKNHSRSYSNDDSKRLNLLQPTLSGHALNELSLPEDTEWVSLTPLWWGHHGCAHHLKYPEWKSGWGEVGGLCLPEPCIDFGKVSGYSNWKDRTIYHWHEHWVLGRRALSWCPIPSLVLMRVLPLGLHPEKLRLLLFLLRKAGMAVLSMLEHILRTNVFLSGLWPPKCQG